MGVTDVSTDRHRGNDCLTTFLGGVVGLIVFGGLIIMALSWIFDR